MLEESPLPVTERTRHRRLREQGSTDRGDLADILAAGMTAAAPHWPRRQLTEGPVLPG